MGKGLKIEAKDYKALTGKRIAVVTAEWNDEITFALRDGALATLKSLGWPEEHIHQYLVPGAFELTTGSKWMVERADIDAVIALGCVIQGETRHFDFICDAVAQGLTNLSLVSGKPVIFGVLTTDTFEQAKARSGGSVGNKGVEAAWTAIKMLELREELRKESRAASIGFTR